MFKLIKDRKRNCTVNVCLKILIILTVSKGSGISLAGSDNIWCKYFVRVKQQDNR